MIAIGNTARAGFFLGGRAAERRRRATNAARLALFVVAASCATACKHEEAEPNADLVGNWCGSHTERFSGSVGPTTVVHSYARLRADDSVEYVMTTMGNPISEMHYYGRWDPEHLEFRYGSRRGDEISGRITVAAGRRSIVLANWDGSRGLRNFASTFPDLTREACAEGQTFVSQGFSDNAHRTTGRREGPRSVNPEMLQADAAHPWAGDWCSLGLVYDPRAGGWSTASEVIRIYPDLRMRRAFGPGMPTDVCSQGTFDPTNMQFSMSGCLIGHSGHVRLESRARQLYVYYGNNATPVVMSRIDCPDVDAAHLQAVAR